MTQNDIEFSHIGARGVVVEAIRAKIADILADIPPRGSRVEWYMA